MEFECLETPCFIINRKELEENIVNFQNAISKKYKQGILAFSVKTNSLGYLLKVAREKSCYAEVVSHDEYMLARHIGYHPSKIIYNGPLKSQQTFLEAVNNGAIVNIENFREIEWLKCVNNRENINIGLRVNVNLDSISPEDAGEYGKSRFGFSYENGELTKAISLINQYGFHIKGLHVHRTSATRSLNVYANICKFVRNIISTERLNLSYIDIGGGFYGNLPGKPTYDDYVNVISEYLGGEDMKIIFEPGNGIIASPISYVMSVLDVKNIDNQTICVTDGSRIDIDPLFHKSDYFKEIIRRDVNRKCSSKMQVFTGCTCLENDILFRLKEYEEEVLPKDKVLIKAVGAYTMTLTPNFIRMLPNVYEKCGNEYKLVRNKWTYQEVIQGLVNY